jgi:hypothetical protein
VTDAGLGHVGELKRLTHLTLCNLAITDAGLNELQPLKRLTQLNLSYNASITSRGVESLGQLQELRILDLSHTAVGNRAMREIANFKKLESLNIAATNVSDEGIGHLLDTRHLRALCVVGTPVTWEGLSGLYKLPNLANIDTDAEGTCWERHHGLSLMQREYAASRIEVPKLIKALDDSDWRVRNEAVTKLARFTAVSQEAVGALLEQGVIDKNATVRRWAVNAIAGLSTRAALRPLINSLGDADQTVRCEAIYGLGKWAGRYQLDGDLADSERAVLALIDQGLRDTNTDNAISAVAQLDKNFMPEGTRGAAIRALSAVVADPQLVEAVRETATDTLLKWQQNGADKQSTSETESDTSAASSVFP